MSQAINRYKADLREMKFRLYEQFNLRELLGTDRFADWDEEACDMVLSEVYGFVQDKIGPTNSIGDEVGCKLVDGKVITPPGFKAAWDALNEAGYRAVAMDPDMGGAGAPFSLGICVEEMIAGANSSFAMYPGLTVGAAEVIHHFGTPEQVEIAKKMYAGQWGGTMCLTEPQAGSDVGAATTKAAKQDDGTYKIEGTKIFISAGDHDLTDNIIHLVLARTDDAPVGTKGLSLFIVPRNKFEGGANNDVKVGSIEHKMGIKGSSTCVLNFGEDGDCVGYLIGTEERRGMRQMFMMMNFARIGVGLQGLSVASSAYLNALEYTKERKQGPNVKEWKNAAAPKVPIIQHPDVRRMLIDMKSRVEGIRALILKLGVHIDRVNMLKGKDDASNEAEYHQGQIDLLVPLVKAYSSDQAFRICETAIQTYGGAGYLRDHPVEQYCRDSKIFSIYEGTNHIQSMDLVGRKLMQKGGENFRNFVKDITDFVAANKEHPRLSKGVGELGQALEALNGTAMRFLGWFQSGQMEMVPLSANRFLDMMSEVCVGWLLLDGAVIAAARLEELGDSDAPDVAFYQGTVYSAQYYARNVLPGVVSSAHVLSEGDQSALEIPDDAF